MRGPASWLQHCQAWHSAGDRRSSRRENWEKALEAYDRFLSAHPGHVPAYVARAKTRFRAKAFLPAAADY